MTRSNKPRAQIPNKQFVIDDAISTESQDHELRADKHGSGSFFRILIIVGISILLVYVLISGFPSFADSKPIKNIIELDELVRGVHTDQVGEVMSDVPIQTAEPQSDVLVNADSVDEQKQKLDILVAELQAEISHINTTSDSNRKVIKSLSDTIRKVDDSLMMFATRVESIERSLTDVVDNYPNVVKKNASLEKSINSLKKQVKSTSKRLQTIDKRDTNGPPYNVVAIDKWGGIDNVMVELNGKVEPLLVGDSKSGWKLHEIKDNHCAVFAQAKGRTKKTLCYN